MGAQRKIPSEFALDAFIPYACHVTESIIKTHSGDYMAFLRLDGVPFESADPGFINGWFEQFHGLMRNINSSKVSIHSHVIRCEYSRYPNGDFQEGFSSDFNSKYKSHIESGGTYDNKLFLSLIYRPNKEKVSLFKSLDESKDDCIEAVDDMLKTATASLYAFGAKVLCAYEFNNSYFSESLEFLNYLVNNEWQRMPYPTKDLRKVIPSSRLFFGKGGAIASRGATKTQYCAVISVSSYPTKISPDRFDNLLRLPFEFTLSNSYAFINKSIAKLQMDAQLGRLEAVKDASIEQIDDIRKGIGGLDGNEISFGDHSLVLLVKAGSIKELDNNINRVGSELSDAGFKWAREDLAAAGGIFSIMPGNFKYRINTQMVSSENFACFSSYHNFPFGRTINQWGDPVSAFKTTSHGTYLFNFHDGDGDKIDPNHFEAASTLIIGKTGTGKTVLFGFLLSMLQKYRTDEKKLTAVVFDRDYGTSIIVRALGGKFYPLKLGIPSGFQVTHCELNEKNIEFLVTLVKQLVRHDGFPITPIDEKNIIDAVNALKPLAFEHRSLTAIKEFLVGTEIETGNSIADRLAKWCKGGANGWLLDNNEDTLNVDAPCVGFDVTEFIDSPEIKTATMMYLLHRINHLQDGRRLPIFMDEFGILLNDPVFKEMAEKGIITGRKRDSFYVMAAQDTQQILKSDIAYALVNQTSTKIFLPNPNASQEHYCGKFGLTEEEFKIIRLLPERSRRFLIKQGHKSVVAELNLAGFDNELAVLSGNILTAKLVNDIIEEVGNDPNVWLPLFHDRRVK